MSHYTVHFPKSDFSCVKLSSTDELSVGLNAQNSPVLFGCRTGICGTCVAIARGALPPPDAEEQEVLDALAPGIPDARLCCQLHPEGDIELEVIEA